MITGEVFVGWVIGTLAFAGLWGAIRNETWLSVIESAINPKATPTRIM